MAQFELEQTMFRLLVETFAICAKSQYRAVRNVLPIVREAQG